MMNLVNTVIDYLGMAVKVAIASPMILPILPAAIAAGFLAWLTGCCQKGEK
jgi:hypothetical protein